MNGNAAVDSLIGLEVASIVAGGDEKKPGKFKAWMQRKFTWMPRNAREGKCFAVAWGLSGAQTWMTAGVAAVAWNWVVNLIPLGVMLFLKAFGTKFLAMMSVLFGAAWKVAT